MPHLSVDDTCPGEEEIAAFLRGVLAPQRVRTLEAHVARCATCRRLLSALARAAATESHPAADSVSPTLPLDTGGGDAELPVGARIGRYVVIDWLGAGGMGVVYTAYDPELSRKVALKVLRNPGTDPADRPPLRDLLQREAQAMARLAHPNVVTVFDVGSVDDRVFIAMELIEGMTLAQWLAAGHRTLSEIIATFLAAGNGLAAAHAAGLIHRDFKPDNVIIGNDGRVRVTDFGLARPVPREPFEPAQPAAAAPGRGAHATQTGLAGTLAYMAPEQFLRRSADARADQFSFAVALYEALYGERPFGPQRFFPGNAAASQPAIVPPRDASVPAALRQVLLRALRAEPGERYPSMRELLAALAPRPRRNRPRVVGALVIVVAAIIAASGYAIHLRRAADQRTALVGQLRGLAPEMRTQMRSAHMLPLHDVRPAREEVRRVLRDVERQLKTPAGQDEIALVSFVLGEGYWALGDHQRALDLLEASWAAGERGPRMDAALGAALGAAYERRFNDIELVVPSSHRVAQIRDIEARYRDPAMIHLRAALEASAGSPAYLEALISFHEHRFAESSRSAHAAFAASPTFYEAGVLEAKAHNEAGRALLATDKGDDANAEFAEARRIFERVLEIARSDDEAWLAYGEMVYEQAHALARGDLPGDLRQQAITALHTAGQINPESWRALLLEAQIHEQEANIAIIWYRDPGPHIDKVLGLTDQARAHGADADQVDVLVCLAHWTRAAYQGSHGVDPHAAFEQALAACQRAAAAKPTADKYSSLAAVHASLASYEADHGVDPTHAFSLGERHLRTAIGIADSAALHYNLGQLWTDLAHYQEGHGLSPLRAVDDALDEFKTAVQMDATRADGWTGMAYVLIARARALRAAQQEIRPTLAQAHGFLDRALAIEATLVPPIWHRIKLAELDAEALLDRRVNPAPAVARMRADAQLLLRRSANDGFAHRSLCQAELIAARWALAHHGTIDQQLTRATAEAALARASEPMHALSWTTSADVELLRARAVRARGAAPDAAIAAGLAFVERAMTIDAHLVRTLALRDALIR